MIMLDKMIEDLLEEPVVDNNEIVFTSRAVELIHEISEKCKGIQIVEQTREQAEEYAKDLTAEQVYYDMLCKIVDAPTTLHMKSYKNATLLYGPPGTGKTMFGKYIAYKMGLPFCYLNFSKVVDSYMGVTSRNIAQAFTYASTNPCVFMLDEVDTISCNRERTSSGADREIGRVTVTLMQEFDKLANDVVVIAATNRLDILDKAFVSRCSQKYEMPPFTADESKQMVNKFLDDIGISIPDIEIDQVIQKNNAQRTIMADVIRLIADRLEVEDENS